MCIRDRLERTVEREVRFPTCVVDENRPAHIMVGAETAIEDERVPYGQSVKLRIQRLKDGRLRTRFDLELSSGASQILKEQQGAVVEVDSDRFVGAVTLRENVTTYIDCKGAEAARTWLEMKIVPCSGNEKQLEQEKSE